MKRFEPKSIALLTLPSLGLLVLAIAWPRYRTWQQEAPTYELARYEIVKENSPFPADTQGKGTTLCLHARVNFSHRNTIHTLRRLGNRRPMDYWRIALAPRCIAQGKNIFPLRKVWKDRTDHLELSFYYDVGPAKPSSKIVFATTLQWRDGFPNQELPQKEVRLTEF